MYCNKCGSEIDVNDKFCGKCGNRLENYPSTTGSITFRREGQYYGFLVPIKVFLDGNLVATLSTGNEIRIPTTIGKHRIAFDLWSGNGQYDVEVTKEHPNIKIEFKLGVGAVTSKPKIVRIINI